MKLSLALLSVVSLLIMWHFALKPTKGNAAEATKYNELTPEEQRVILHEGTERAFTGAYYKHYKEGVYLCKQCDRPLFDFSAKFDSGTGWPSFDDTIEGGLREVPDGSRTEIECANCGGHIGHVFRGEQMTVKNTRHCANSISLNFVAESNLETGIFAGGCFWGVEHHLQNVPGVLSVVSGYIGGHKDNPTYKEVCSTDTGHAEAVQVLYDSSKVSYETIAKVFFEIHDPTQVNQQGPDIGRQYRSAVFYLNNKQREIAQGLIDELKKMGLEVETELVPAGTFWSAEEYHQDYYQKTGGEPYCHARVKRFEWNIEKAGRPL